MERLFKIILIVFGALICLAGIVLPVSLYSQNQRLTNSLQELKTKFEDTEKDRDSLKTRLEDSENKREGLKKENDTYIDKLKNNAQLIEQASRQKNDLEKDLAAAKDDLREATEARDKLQQGFEEERLKISQLNKENAVLKLHEQEIEKEKSAQHDREEEAMFDRVAGKTNLKALKPKDFISDFSGNEEFLRDCTTPLCTKIILNNTGIKYARQGQWGSAEEAFKKALTLDSNYKPAKLNLGLVYDKLKTKKEAFDYWLVVLGLQPKLPTP